MIHLKPRWRMPSNQCPMHSRHPIGARKAGIALGAVLACRQCGLEGLVDGLDLLLRLRGLLRWGLGLGLGGRSRWPCVLQLLDEHVAPRSGGRDACGLPRALAAEPAQGSLDPPRAPEPATPVVLLEGLVAGLGAGPLDAEFVQDSRRRDSGRLRRREKRVAVLDDSGLGRPVELEQRVVPRRALVVQHDVHVHLAPHFLEDLAPLALEHVGSRISPSPAKKTPSLGGTITTPSTPCTRAWISSSSACTEPSSGRSDGTIGSVCTMPAP